MGKKHPKEFKNDYLMSFAPPEKWVEHREKEMGVVITKGTFSQMQDILKTQGNTGNWDVDDYMCGMFNGMELMMSIIEDREPEYKTLKKDE